MIIILTGFMYTGNCWCIFRTFMEEVCKPQHTSCYPAGCCLLHCQFPCKSWFYTTKVGLMIIFELLYNAFPQVHSAAAYYYCIAIRKLSRVISLQLKWQAANVPILIIMIIITIRHLSALSDVLHPLSALQISCLQLRYPQ